MKTQAHTIRMRSARPSSDPTALPVPRVARPAANYERARALGHHPGSYTANSMPSAALQRSLLPLAISPAPSGALQRFGAEDQEAVDAVAQQARDIIAGIEDDGAAYIEAHWKHIDAVWSQLTSLYDRLNEEAWAEPSGVDAHEGGIGAEEKDGGEEEDEEETPLDAARSLLGDLKYPLVDAVMDSSEFDLLQDGFQSKWAAEIRTQLDTLLDADPDQTATGPGKVAYQALQMAGQVSWVSGASGDLVNGFRMWLKGDAPDIAVGEDELPTMNCWEGVFYAAFKADLITKEKLQEIYAKSQGDLSATVRAEFSPSLSLPHVLAHGGLVPGDIIMFEAFAEHVAISVGGNKIMSLWNKPGPHPLFQRTTLQAVADAGGYNLYEGIRVIREQTLFQPLQ